MDREDALRLLKGGGRGVRRFNATRPEKLPALSGADLSEANLRMVDLRMADVSGANFSGAKLRGAKLREANLSEANFYKADLRGADLSNADLSRANLSIAYLRKANLSEANLHESKVRGAILREANLYRADLREADLINANLSLATLSFAKLTGVSLSWANLSQTDLRSADLTYATLASTLVACELSEARGLDKTHHGGPSYVATQTLSQFKGDIPETFLRGCGLLPWEIKACKLYDKTLNPMQVTEIQNEIFDQRTHGPLFIGGVFISYSHENSTVVDKMYQHLWDNGANVWLDRHDLVAGPLEKQVFDAIRMQDVVLIVLSEASINSDWVKAEIKAGRERERKENRHILCPIALDDAWKEKTIDSVLWGQVAENNILDFSDWEDDKSFTTVFDRLIRGLKFYYKPVEETAH